MPAKDDPRRVLITRFSALGDVAMTIPVVYSVCRAHPDRRFIFLTRRGAGGLFLERPENLEVEEADLRDYRGAAGMWRLAGELRRRHAPEAVADLHDVLRTRLLRWALRLRGVRSAHILKGRRGKRALTRRRNKVMVPLVSTRARYREVFFRLGLHFTDSFGGYWAGGAEPDPSLYAAATPPPQPGETWIAIAPFARHRGKIYPAELMEQVVRALAARPGVKLFLLGAGAEESNILGAWALLGDNIVNMASLRIGLEGEMAILRLCSALISMDSANMHLASLTGTRVVSVWGATHPFCGFMGWRQSKEDAVGLDMTCRPCSVYGARPCHRGDFHCMYGITPQLILRTLDRRITGADR